MIPINSHLIVCFLISCAWKFSWKRRQYKSFEKKLSTPVERPFFKVSEKGCVANFAILLICKMSAFQVWNPSLVSVGPTLESVSSTFVSAWWSRDPPWRVGSNSGEPSLLLPPPPGRTRKFKSFNVFLHFSKAYGSTQNYHFYYVAPKGPN